MILCCFLLIKIKRPLDVYLCLRPNGLRNGKESYVTVDLQVQCPPTYPDVWVSLLNPSMGWICYRIFLSRDSDVYNVAHYCLVYTSGIRKTVWPLSWLQWHYITLGDSTYSAFRKNSHPLTFSTFCCYSLNFKMDCIETVCNNSV